MLIGLDYTMKFKQGIQVEFTYSGDDESKNVSILIPFINYIDAVRVKA